MDNAEFFEALKLLQKEKGIEGDYLLEKIHAAIVIAVKRDFGGKENINVIMDPATNEFSVSLRKTVVDEVEERFERLGILYVRNYRAGLGLSWREAFQTDSRTEVEAFCAEHRIAHAWIGDEHLRTWQRRAAFQRHPHTGERLWFNHGMFFHASSLEPGLRDALLRSVAEEDLPYQTYYGDGSPIEAQTLATIRSAIDRETRRFDWRVGDVLILDNMLAQHGREPFRGPRRILTIMSTPYSSLAPADVPPTPSRLALGGAA